MSAIYKSRKNCEKITEEFEKSLGRIWKKSRKNWKKVSEELEKSLGRIGKKDMYLFGERLSAFKRKVVDDCERGV